MKPVAVCLLTCERSAYTAKTVTHFLAHNPDRARFLLLHGDDASGDERNIARAADAGFETVVRPPTRQGIVEMERQLAAVAASRGAEWTLILENDWEFVRGFPWALFDNATALDNVFCVRLYGAFKQLGRRAGNGLVDPGWHPLLGAPEPAEIGLIHWGSPPSVTRTDVLQYVLDGATRDRDAREKSLTLGLYTVRPVENVVFHFGAEGTPGFKP